MLPSITPPPSLPPFLAKQHGQESLPLFATTTPQAGLSRRRQLFTPGVPRTLEFEWDLTQDRMTVLDAWFESILLAGEREFSVQVANLGPGLLWFAARFVEPYSAAADDASNWRVTGRLLLTGAGSIDAPPPAALVAAIQVALRGSAGLRVLKPLAAAVTVALTGPTPVTLTSIGSSQGSSLAVGRNSGVTSAVGSSTGSANAQGRAFSSGRVQGLATVSGVGYGLSVSTGSSSGAATVSGSGRSLSKSAGSSSGASSVTGIPSSQATSTGSASGTATVTGIS